MFIVTIIVNKHKKVKLISPPDSISTATMAARKQVKIQDIKSNVNIETRTLQMLVDKLEETTLTDAEQLVSRF